MLATCRPHAARNGRTSKSAKYAVAVQDYFPRTGVRLPRSRFSGNKGRGRPSINLASGGRGAGRFRCSGHLGRPRLARKRSRLIAIGWRNGALAANSACKIAHHGNATTALIRKLFFKGTRHFAHKPRVRAVMAAITLVALAPFAWLANSQAARRDASKFASGWTTAVLRFGVKKKPKIQPAREIGQIGRESHGRPQDNALSAATVA